VPAKGFTLIEIMIAMVIGLVVIGGASAMFYSIHRNYMLQLAISQVEDEGHFAVQYMGDLIRMTGYRHMMAPDPQGLEINGDTLILRFDSTFGCDGQKLAQYAAYEYQFSLGDDQSLQRTCSSAGTNGIGMQGQGTTTTEPIAGSSDSRYGSQIEDLQFRVGIDRDGDGSVDRYDQPTAVNWKNLKKLCKYEVYSFVLKSQAVTRSFMTKTSARNMYPAAHGVREAHLKVYPVIARTVIVRHFYPRFIYAIGACHEAKPRDGTLYCGHIAVAADHYRHRRNECWRS